MASAAALSFAATGFAANSSVDDNIGIRSASVVKGLEGKILTDTNTGLIPQLYGFKLPDEQAGQIISINLQPNKTMTATTDVAIFQYLTNNMIFLSPYDRNHLFDITRKPYNYNINDPEVQINNAAAMCNLGTDVITAEMRIYWDHRIAPFGEFTSWGNQVLAPNSCYGGGVLWAADPAPFGQLYFPTTMTVVLAPGQPIDEDAGNNYGKFGVFLTEQKAQYDSSISFNPSVGVCPDGKHQITATLAFTNTGSNLLYHLTSSAGRVQNTFPDLAGGQAVSMPVVFTPTQQNQMIQWASQAWNIDPAGDMMNTRNYDTQISTDNDPLCSLSFRQYLPMVLK